MVWSDHKSRALARGWQQQSFRISTSNISVVSSIQWGRCKQLISSAFFLYFEFVFMFEENCLQGVCDRRWLGLRRLCNTGSRCILTIVRLPHQKQKTCTNRSIYLISSNLVFCELNPTITHTQIHKYTHARNHTHSRVLLSTTQPQLVTLKTWNYVTLNHLHQN